MVTLLATLTTFANTDTINFPIQHLRPELQRKTFIGIFSSLNFVGGTDDL